MKTIKTIITDLDGTLLTSESKISKATKEVLIKAQENGIQLILASGRPTPAIMNFAHELEMDKHGGLLISYNGACVVDVSSKSVLYSQPVPSDITTKILNHIKNFDVLAMVTDDKYMYVEDVYSGVIDLHGFLWKKMILMLLNMNLEAEITYYLKLKTSKNLLISHSIKFSLQLIQIT